MEISVTLDLMCSMESKIVIFEGNMKDGLFTRSKRFYPEDFSEEDIYEAYKKCRISLGEKCGFSGLKMFHPIQKMEDNDNYPDDKAVILDEKYMQKEDYFTEKIETDILIISDKYPKVAVCHNMADCPVLIAEDRRQGVTALAHCGIYHINRGLPKAIIKSLIDNCNSNPEDIYLYIGSHISKDSYIYDTYPQQATNNEIWQDAITFKDNKYYIDLERAILNQLKDYPLAEIIISPIDTATNPDYASHRMEKLGNTAKKGQNIVGFYYKD